MQMHLHNPLMNQQCIRKGICKCVTWHSGTLKDSLSMIPRKSSDTRLDKTKRKRVSRRAFRKPLYIVLHNDFSTLN